MYAYSILTSKSHLATTVAVSDVRSETAIHVPNSVFYYISCFWGFVFCVMVCVLSLGACDDPAKEETVAACCQMFKKNKMM